MRDPIGLVIRNLVRLNQHATGLNREAQEALHELRLELASLLARHDPSDVLPRFRAGRVQKILDAFDAATDGAYASLFKQIRQDLSKLGSIQADFATELLGASLGDVTVTISGRGLGVNHFKSIVDSRPVHGKLLADWFKEAASRTRERVAQQIRLGVAQNETLQQMLVRVRGRSDGRGGFRGGAIGVSTRDAETIVRTATNDIANTAHINTYQQNADIVNAVEFLATLDGRTSEVCIAHDGRTWPIDSEDIARPPLHPRCRSTIVPVIDWDGLGLEPPPEGTRASAGGQVPSSTTYEDWLRAQPPGVQDEVLGKGKAKLFRDRKLSLRDLVKRDRTVRTLDELAASR